MIIELSQSPGEDGAWSANVTDVSQNVQNTLNPRDLFFTDSSQSNALFGVFKQQPLTFQDLVFGPRQIRRLLDAQA